MSAAGGAGIAQKTVFLSRDSRSTDGRGLESSFAPGGVDYVSPALTFDLSVGIRPTPALSVNVGAFLWFETASEDLRSEPDGQVFMKNGDDVVPLASPSYRLASGTQTFLGPYLAVQFGP